MKYQSRTSSSLCSHSGPHQKSKLTARLVDGKAVTGGHPQVRGARVKEHDEVLRWSADADLPIELDLGRQEAPVITDHSGTGR